MRCVVVAGLVVHAAVASAQSVDSEALEAEARQAAEQGLFGRARELFEQVLADDPSVASAFNYALVLRADDDPLEALAVLERISDGAFGPIAPTQDQPVVDLRRDLERIIATLLIRVRGVPSAEIRVDGELVAESERGRPLQVQTNPGDRRRLVTSSGRDPIERVVAADSGATTEVAFRFPPAPVEPEERRGSPWPWIIGTVASLVVVGAVVAVVALVGQNDGLPDPPENFLGTAEALRTVEF
ncbi:MAG: hypothetical protein AAGF12_33420 [Myxococcota bacterium]